MHPDYKYKPRRSSEIKRRPGGRKDAAEKEVGPATTRKAPPQPSIEEQVARTKGSVNQAAETSGGYDEGRGGQLDAQADYNFGNMKTGSTRSNVQFDVAPSDMPSFEEAFGQEVQRELDWDDYQYWFPGLLLHEGPQPSFAGDFLFVWGGGIGLALVVVLIGKCFLSD